MLERPFRELSTEYQRGRCEVGNVVRGSLAYGLIDVFLEVDDKDCAECRNGRNGECDLGSARHTGNFREQF